MKSKLEQSIKQSLENYEAPYNSAAWENMKSTLDNKMPTTGRSSNWKWYGAASVAAVLIVASYFIFSDNESQDNKQITSKVDTIDNNEINNDKTENVNSKTIAADKVNNTNNNEVADQQSDFTVEESQVANIGELPTMSYNLERVDQNSPVIPNQGNGLMQPNNSEPAKPETVEYSLILPKVNSVCAGEVIDVRNENSVPLLVNGPDLEFMIPANETRKIRTKSGGVHTVSALNGSNESVEFIVLDAPDAEFIIEFDNKYDSGIPTTEVEATVPGTNFKWSYGNETDSGRQAEVHLYEKGTHTINLTVTGSNGCTNTTAKTISVEEDYNLLAANAINPNSSIPENRTFMPVALVERNVPFTLIVLDPKDGHTIYETRDASSPWDGIDRQSGQPVPFGSYIWKVFLDQKAKGEKKNEYIGEIVIVDSNK